MSTKKTQPAAGKTPAEKPKRVQRSHQKKPNTQSMTQDNEQAAPVSNSNATNEAVTNTAGTGLPPAIGGGEIETPTIIPTEGTSNSDPSAGTGEIETATIIPTEGTSNSDLSAGTGISMNEALMSPEDQSKRNDQAAYRDQYLNSSIPLGPRPDYIPTSSISVGPGPDYIPTSPFRPDSDRATVESIDRSEAKEPTPDMMGGPINPFPVKELILSIAVRLLEISKTLEGMVSGTPKVAADVVKSINHIRIANFSLITVIGMIDSSFSPVGFFDKQVEAISHDNSLSPAERIDSMISMITQYRNSVRTPVYFIATESVNSYWQVNIAEGYAFTAISNLDIAAMWLTKARDYLLKLPAID